MSHFVRCGILVFILLFFKWNVSAKTASAAGQAAAPSDSGRSTARNRFPGPEVIGYRFCREYRNNQQTISSDIQPNIVSRSLSVAIFLLAILILARLLIS